MAVRLATEADVEAIAGLWFAFCLEMSGIGVPDKAAWIKRTISFFRMDDCYHVVISEDNGGRLTGFIDSFRYYEPAFSKIICEGMHFYVIPAARDGETAYRLLDFIRTFNKNKGFELEGVTCGEQTKKMWERKGYVVDKYVMHRVME